jgi:hypothetical protein
MRARYHWIYNTSSVLTRDFRLAIAVVVSFLGMSMHRKYWTCARVMLLPVSSETNLAPTTGLACELRLYKCR